MITDKQILMVQSSFAKVAPIAPVAADLFYARLFELDPDLRKLFKGDMKSQGAMLMSMLSTAVRGLSDSNALIQVLMALGRRHTGYGVQDRDYATVGQALLWTLEQGLGEDFTPEVREAWATAYDMIATVMQQGGRMALRAA
jgi:hemoglobin-like flavoprotein